MAIQRSNSRKAASQSPVDFFNCKQSGGAHGGTGKAPEKPRSGPQREKIYGRKDMGR